MNYVKGKQVKELINANISDDDIVCIGEQYDSLGRFDRQIVGVETRQVGFDASNTYKAIITKPYNSNGALKFWQ